MAYNFSLSKKESTLLIVAAVLLTTLIFVSGFVSGLLIELPASDNVQNIPVKKQVEPSTAAAPPKDLKKDEKGSAVPQQSPAGQKTDTGQLKIEVPELKATKSKLKNFTAPDTLPYSIILAHFAKEENARQAFEKFQDQGLEPYLFPVNLENRGRWWRIHAGFFTDKPSAVMVAEELKLKDYQVIKKPYSNLIMESSSYEELQSVLKKLEELDYYPYIIKDTPHNYRLMVGACKYPEEAEEIFDKLKADGIDSKVVER